MWGNRCDTAGRLREIVQIALLASSEAGAGNISFIFHPFEEVFHARDVLLCSHLTTGRPNLGNTRVTLPMSSWVLDPISHEEPPQEPSEGRMVMNELPIHW